MRALGVRALAANIVNTIVGSGIFVLPAIVAAILGPAAVVAYIICTTLVALFGAQVFQIVYANFFIAGEKGRFE